MKKTLLLTTLFLSLNANAMYLNYCFNSGNEFDNSLEYCVNGNFRTVGWEVDNISNLSNCYNYGDRGVSYSYEFCVNQNFRDISRALNNELYLSHCFNSNIDSVSFLFVSCINENFGNIQRYIGY